MILTPLNKRTSESGSALIYILIAIALLAALTFTFMEPSSQQTSSQNTFKTLTAVQGQADIIRAAIQECVLSSGASTGMNDNTATTGPMGTDPGARTLYPLKPNSSHFTGTSPGPTAGRLVKDLRCPNKNPGTPNENDHELIFQGGSGKFMPSAPDLFEDWQYYNGTDGVFFWTQTDKSDSFLLSALEKLDEKFSECEADIIEASSGAVDMDSATPAEIQCENGHVCFRIWMVSNPTAEYPDAPETGNCP